MSVIQSYGGALLALNALTASWIGTRRIGLYQNNWSVQPWQGISAVVPADFSGYSGLVPLTGWLAAVQSGPMAVATADQVLWSHNGGPVQNWIFGVYVVAPDGSLDWADPFPGDPRPLFYNGHFLDYVPTYALQSKFSGV